MKVAVVCEPLAVPPQFYGGIERMCHLLCDGLVKNGHEINLLASKDSVDYNGYTRGYRNPSKSLLDRAWCRASFSAKSLALAWSADIVYSFRFWPEYLSAINHLRKPVIYCQQNSGKPNDLSRVLKSNPNYGFMQGISKDQISAVESASDDRLFMIYNAVNTDIIRAVPNASGLYLAYLGRLNYDKGIDIAVAASRITGVPLKIAGVVRPDEPDAQLLFEESVKPFLGDQIEFIGPIDDSQKTEFLGNALALLMPNRWREPFGITMAEALAAGTPVIGTDVGSIPEVIEHNKTGFVCKSLDEICDAVCQVHLLDRLRCRESALTRFSQPAYMLSILSMFNKVRALVN